MTTVITPEEHLSPSMVWEFVIGVRLVKADELRHFRSCGECLGLWCDIRRKAQTYPTSRFRNQRPRRVMQRGEVNTESAYYRTLCCEAEITISAGETFPDCPNHSDLPTIWMRIGPTPVAKAAEPHIVSDENDSAA